MLQIKNLHVEVEDKKILNGINLHIKRGEMHAIMGLNGPLQIRLPAEITIRSMLVRSYIKMNLS